MRRNVRSRNHNIRGSASTGNLNNEDAEILLNDPDVNLGDFLPNEDDEISDESCTPRGRYCVASLTSAVQLSVLVLVVLHIYLTVFDRNYHAMKPYTDLYGDMDSKFGYGSKDSLVTNNFLDLKNTVDELQKEINFLKTLVNDTINWRTNFDMQMSHIYNEIVKSNSKIPTNVEQKIQEAITLYDSDKLGLIDYALETSGGAVTSTPDTVPFPSRIVYEIFGLIRLKSVSNPRLIIQPTNYPGQCFAFHGCFGKIRIQLSKKIHITSVSLEHAHSSLLDDMSSAPKKFRVYGLEDKDSENGEEIGQFSYEISDQTLQTFNLEQPDRIKSFENVELHILSNQGHPEYTCVYRFRVHGKSVENKE